MLRKDQDQPNKSVSNNSRTGFRPVRIWYGRSVFWKAGPYTVRTESKTGKCPQKPCCPHQMSVFSSL
jgi:hypothetical protein